MKFGVIGLGRFGYHVATVLTENGMDVLAIDSNDSIVASIKDYVTQAICMRVADEASLRSVGVDEMDVVIVAMGENFAQSILATALIKKHLHVPKVITRAIDDIHCEILTLVGADQVILPEKEIGINLAESLSSPFTYIARLSKEFSIGQIETPKSLVGKKISDLSIFYSYHVTCIGIRRADIFISSTSEEFDELILEKNDEIVLAGEHSSLSRLAKL